MLEPAFHLSGGLLPAGLVSAGVLSSPMQTVNAAKLGKDLAAATDRTGEQRTGEASELQILLEYLGLPILFAYLDFAAAASQHAAFLGAWVPPRPWPLRRLRGKD